MLSATVNPPASGMPPPLPGAPGPDGRAVVTDQRPRAQEMLRQLASRTGADLYEPYDRARSRSMSLSHYLEQQMPASDYRDGLDAYSRLLMLAGIRVNSHPMGDWVADEAGKFLDTPEGKLLFPEWIERQRRRVWAAAMPQTQTRAVTYATTDTTLGGVLSPFIDTDIPVVAQLAPLIPIQEVIAANTPVDSDVYRGFYLTDTAAQERLVRVSQGAELPRMKIAGSDHTVRAYKYGRLLEMTYEVLRRMRIDLVALHVQRVMIQQQIDELAAILDVLINGDGNTNTSATTYNLTTLDTAATAGTLTVRGWLSFKLKFPNPYYLTTVIAQEATTLQMLLLNVGSANIPLVVVQQSTGLGSLVPINPTLGDNVRYGFTSAAPTLQIVGLDRRFAIERFFEPAGNIQESVRFVERQVEGLAISQLVGYRALDSKAYAILNVNA